MKHARFVGKPDQGQDFTATLVLIRGSSAEDIGAFASLHKLRVVGSRPGKAVLSGSVAQWEAALGITFGLVTAEDELATRGEKWRPVFEAGRKYRTYDGTPRLPPWVVAILGLDERPVSVPHFRALAAQANYTAAQVAELYDFPTSVNGTGINIGLLELGGGYDQSDLSRYFSSVGLTVPKVTPVSVDGATNSPTGDPSSADGEVCLDIEVAGSVSSGASISVYFAPNTDQGFVDAVDAAVSTGSTVLSISWGQAEEEWDASSLQALNMAMEDAANSGMTVTVAAGDNGSSDGMADGLSHVDFPGSSPFVICCGGTSLQGRGTTIIGEVVWDNITKGDGATGGGVSNVFPLPSWQSSTKIPVQVNSGKHGRGVPDIAGSADPLKGYTIVVDGVTMTVGGTSAVAPLIAGLVALSAQEAAQAGKPHALGLLNPRLYSFGEGACYHDIVSGNNGAYSAGPGWDACSGWGSPVGAQIAASISSAKAQPQAPNN